jgi:hypothetical protein
MRDKILTDLFKSQELKDLLSKMNPDHLRDDLKQELFLALCEKPAEQIISLHERKELRWYAARIVWNMIASNTSPFYKKFRVHLEKFLSNNVIGINHELIEEETTEEKEYKHTALLDAVNRSLDGMHFYERELFVRYVAAGSAMKLINIMKEATDGHYIPKRTILLTVKTVKEKIKKDIRA